MHEGEKDEVGRLLEQYRVATEAYAKAVNELVKWRGMVSLEEYTKLVLIVQSAREECERVRMILHDGSEATER